ncbi:YgdI/YgdR family lipoprotein [Endozoicomonas sp. 4G]|uniref:YgdI/YgdR family lipoprotein n=1 Tax=Endozoicomonas sp. 4G TaxID=2872754 RepID=UPI002078E137|nr:YgdI/YgdR family lipoprotein [Endozoicomonas sp. 4G]
MKRINLILVLIITVLLVGCASPHVITLKDGRSITTKDTPRMKPDGFYQYETLDGLEASVNGDEVLEIHQK